MADSNIGSLPGINILDNNSLFVAEQQGSAVKVTGEQLLNFANVGTFKRVSSAVNKAETAANNADISEKSASASALSAANSQSESAKSEEQAKSSEEQAKTYAENAEKSNKSSESWAVGGTGTRSGEDTNNSKYWAEQAHNAAGGGVSSFNGRAGFVMPQEGDYTPEMVGASPASLIDRVLLHEYMMTYNDFVAPLATDDSVLTVIVDDENNAILANWKYKEV